MEPDDFDPPEWWRDQPLPETMTAEQYAMDAIADADGEESADDLG